MTVTVQIYSAERKEQWDNFIRSARNGHFMFFRDYMEYHSHRFNDCSLMLYDAEARLLAVVPANLDGRVFHSHQGLSFGGLIAGAKTTAAQVIELIHSIVAYLRHAGLADKIIYKKIPEFYCRQPAQEDLYAFYLLHATLVRRDISSVIDLRSDFSYTKGRKWSVNRAKKNNITVAEEIDLSEYWALLGEVLQAKHGAAPVHSLAEIELLRSRFPANIRCFVGRLRGEVLAGAVVYEADTAAHVQYLANSDIGRELGALDLVLDHLIKNVYCAKRYFDFGISTENNGRLLNEGLIAQKEGFGARGYVQDFYELSVG
jgi:hypothetical protein